MRSQATAKKQKADIYTEEERVRRDSTSWTLVQGILAPIQFLVFGVSLVLIIRFMWTGEGQEAAAMSVLVKTLVLYTIMVTGAAWEKAVFGQWLFAPAFFWEDVVSFGVIALHTLYVWMWFGANADPMTCFLIALAAYASYLVNAAQFLIKFGLARRARAARSDRSGQSDDSELGVAI
jgi:3-vinyl bacteriochlorophyllide hydratase